jgi:uncharacterized glyoxalase superfamily protein PhnB
MNEQLKAHGQTIFPSARYTDAREAIAWLGRAFAAEPHVVYDAPDGTVAHAELIIAGNIFMLGHTRDDDYPVRSPREVKAVTGALYVALPDAVAVEAMYVRAEAAGAQILQAPYDTDYGSREFRVFDLDGNPWTFGTYKPEHA